MISEVCNILTSIIDTGSGCVTVRGCWRPAAQNSMFLRHDDVVAFDQIGYITRIVNIKTVCLCVCVCLPMFVCTCVCMCDWLFQESVCKSSPACDDRSACRRSVTGDIHFVFPRLRRQILFTSVGAFLFFTGASKVCCASPIAC